MKRLILAATFFAMPAFAQQAATEIEVEGRGLIDRWVVAYNRGDAETLVADIYAAGDRAKLKAMFEDLHAESFGKLDPYGAAFCAFSATQGRAMLKFTRLYTFGGKMYDDEARIFDLVKTDAGWRIAGETDAPFSTVLSCS